jgi:hypothetical protein
VVETRDTFSPFGPPGNGGLSRRPQGEFGLLKRVVLAKITQKLKEPDIPWQVVLTHAAKHAQTRLEQRKGLCRKFSFAAYVEYDLAFS